MSSSWPKRRAVAAMSCAGMQREVRQTVEAVELAVGGAGFGHAVRHQDQRLAGAQVAATRS